MSDINVTIVAATNASTSILNSDIVSVSAGPGFVGGGATALLVEAGANITVTTTSGSFTVIGRDIPVLSVAGRTGNIVLTAADVGGLTSVGNVTKVNGRTGAVSLVSTDVSAASAVHSHVASDIVNLTAVANVVSVNGRTGAVSLVSTDVSAASAVHSHVASDISNLTSVANVVSVNGRTGAVTLVAGANVTLSTAGSSITISAAAGGGGGGTTGGSVTSVNGQVGTVVLTAVDVSAASSTHTHNYVTSLNGNTGSLSVVAGSNVTVTTSAGSIVVDATGEPGPAGPAGSFGDPQTISQKTASYTLQLSDVGTLLACSGTAGTITLTIPAATAVSWVQGSHIDVARIGAAGVQVSGGGGVSVLATPSAALRDVGSGASLVCLGTNEWLLVGDLA